MLIQRIPIFVVEMGAEAIHQVLSLVDINAELKQLQMDYERLLPSRYVTR